VVGWEWENRCESSVETIGRVQLTPRGACWSIFIACDVFLVTYAAIYNSFGIYFELVLPVGLTNQTSDVDGCANLMAARR